MYGKAYLDSLIASRDHGKLVELSTILCGSATFRRSEPDYGFPGPVFVFVESVLWFAQAIRSGVWTYYEATPISRQQAMLRALESEAPAGFATQYALGMRCWQDETKIEEVDRWIADHDGEHNLWLWRLVNEHRPSIERICA